VRKAAAQDAGQGFLNLLVGGFGFLIKQNFRGKDYAAEAESTLGCAFINEGLLDGMRLFGRSQPFERGDFAMENGADGCDAGAGHFTVDEDGASSALSEAAAEFWTAQVEVVAKNVEEWSASIDFYGMELTVYF
jgi:hypothetical protein